MQCPRCLNTDTKYFYKGSNGFYCRRCISFARTFVEENLEPISLSKIEQGANQKQLIYPLTKNQEIISNAIIRNMFKTDILVEAVCGAGKTEIMVGPISECLRKNKKVCFAIARRQVVLELSLRLQKYFPNAKVIAICGGHTNELDGDIIVCTCHQLYRFYSSFDLLILDEPDAFPFKGNDVLHGIAKTSAKGKIIYLTATPDNILANKIKNNEILHLYLAERPHHKPLPVPQIHVLPPFICYIKLITWLKSYQNSPRMVFVPTISDAFKLALFIRPFFKCNFVTSKSENRDNIIQKFRKKKHGILICTTVMERGITIPNVNVCVYHADHNIFDEASLIQMAGRVGRNFNSPDGNVLFLCHEKSDSVDKCYKSIKEANNSCIA